MKVKYQLTDPITEKAATIAIEGETGDSVGELSYEGDKALIKDIQGIIPFLGGIYGHLIGTRTSIIDLNFALTTSPQIEDYSPKLIEGKVPQERSRPPEGVQT